jgi:hypothetical protein
MRRSDLAESCTIPSARPGLWILDTQLTKSALNQIRKKAAFRLDMLRPFLNRSGLSVRNGVLLYKQLIQPMMDYVSHIWTLLPAATSGI